MDSVASGYYAAFSGWLARTEALDSVDYEPECAGFATETLNQTVNNFGVLGGNTRSGVRGAGQDQKIRWMWRSRDRRPAEYAGDAPAVHRLERERLQNEQIERSLEKIRGWRHVPLDIQQKNAAVSCRMGGARSGAD